MSHTVWIMVENDDDQFSANTRVYWSVNNFDTKEEAIEHAELIAETVYSMTGVEPQRLDE